MSTKYTCCGRVQSNFLFYTCGKTAKYERDGKHYCGMHDPVTISEKYVIKNAAFQAKYKARAAARDAVKAKQAEIERRADCYEGLLEALVEVVQILDRDHSAWFKAKAAITKATGETA